jgi:hypothetical protein
VQVNILKAHTVVFRGCKAVQSCIWIPTLETNMSQSSGSRWVSRSWGSHSGDDEEF